MFKRWHQHIEDDAKRFAKDLAPDASKNFLFAAHVGTQYLLACGLPADRFAGVIDNNYDKVGRRLYGSSLRVFAPEVLAGVAKPRVVLRQGVYDDEIESQLKRINPQTLVIRRPGNRTDDASSKRHHRDRGYRGGVGPLLAGPRRLSETSLYNSQTRPAAAAGMAAHGGT